MRTPIRSLIVLVLLGLSFLACGQEPADEAEAAEEAVSSAAAADEPIYDLEIELQGLMGYVPIAKDNSTAGTGETAQTLWALLVNATDPVKLKPPCPDHAPKADDKRYHRHYPVLRYAPENGNILAGGSKIQTPAGEMIEMSLEGLQLELAHSQLEGEGVHLAGNPKLPCFAINDESFECVADLKTIKEELATVCKECVQPLSSLSYKEDGLEVFTARVKLTDGEHYVSQLEFNDMNCTENFSFPATGDCTDNKCDWGDDVSKYRVPVPLSSAQVVKLRHLQGPIKVKLRYLAEPAKSTSVELRPAPGEKTVRLEVRNQTCKNLGKSCDHWERTPWEGREFRWYYLLSENRPQTEAECRNAVLPSLRTHRADESPPICPSVAFQAPGS